MKESEARKKWCPFARSASDGEEAIAINRQYYGDPKQGCLCLGNACMAWQTHKVGGDEGWCGLTNVLCLSG